MSQDRSTVIAWTQHSWNPTTGCTRVSEGCRNCYAERLSLKFGWSSLPWTRQHETVNVQLHPERLNKPAGIKEPSKIFVNSMSDLFHPLIPDDYIARVFEVMGRVNRHTYQVLTKRPERAAAWPGPWPGNIWMGTSVEDARVLHRVDALRSCKAEVRFLSCEPLIGSLGSVDLTGIHWVIVGGESGPGYRVMQQAWAREIWFQCRDQEVSYFYKQDSGPRTEMRPWLVLEDGTKWQIQQYPGRLIAPLRVEHFNEAAK